MFFEPENGPSTYQLSPAIHHNFTTKKPRSTTHFCQNLGKNKVPPPPQKITAEAPLFEQGFRFFTRGLTGGLAVIRTLRRTFSLPRVRIHLSSRSTFKLSIELLRGMPENHTGSTSQRIAAPDLSFALSNVYLRDVWAEGTSPDSAGIRAIHRLIRCLFLNNLQDNCGE
jgi:hypothetical protein